MNALTTITPASTLPTSIFLTIHELLGFLITLAGIVVAVRLVQRRLVEVGALAGKAPKRVTPTITDVRVFEALGGDTESFGAGKESQKGFTCSVNRALPPAPS